MKREEHYVGSRAMEMKVQREKEEKMVGPSEGYKREGTAGEEMHDNATWRCTSIPHKSGRIRGSVARPHSFSCSSYERSVSPAISLVALLCIVFKHFYLCLSLTYGLHTCIQYS